MCGWGVAWGSVSPSHSQTCVDEHWLPLDLVPTDSVLPALAALWSEKVLQMFLVSMLESDGHSLYCADITRKAHLRKTLELAPLRGWSLPGHRARGLFHHCFLCSFNRKQGKQCLCLCLAKWSGFFYIDTEIRGVNYMKKGNFFLMCKKFYCDTETFLIGM